MISRDLDPHARAVADRYPILAITGPRQSGKTTFCRATFPDRPYASLENPEQRRFALQDPRGFLAQYPEGAILDEVQRAPELLSYLQGMVDEHPRAGAWILTGSQHFTLTRAISQSLAGRVALLELFPPSLAELKRFPRPPGDLFSTLFAGAYPRIHDQGLPPREWLASYVATYVERDVREILNVGDLVLFQTYLGQVAGRAAQLLNLSNLAVDSAISHTTARKWLSVLETSYLVFRVAPWLGNLRRRLIKAPKLFFLDSGLLCYQLGIRSPQELVTHPLRGPIFESWVVAEILKAHANRGLRPRLAFYRDRRGIEVDLLLERGRELLAVEIKSGQTVASSFFDAFGALEEALGGMRAAPSLRPLVVYGGDEGQRRTSAEVLSWRALDDFDWVGN